jgi:hypothetical protein
MNYQSETPFDNIESALGSTSEAPTRPQSLRFESLKHSTTFFDDRPRCVSSSQPVASATRTESQLPLSAMRGTNVWM